MADQPRTANGYHRYSLARRMVLYILLFSSMVTLLATSFQLFMDYSRDVEQINARFTEVETSHLGNIVNNVWLTQMDSVRLELEGILRLPDMHAVAVRLEDGEEIFLGQRSGEELVVHRYPMVVTYRGQPRQLGEFTVTASLTGVYGRLWDRVLIILATQTVKTFLVSLFIIGLFHALVGRHLHALAEYTRQVRLKDLPTAAPMAYGKPSRSGKRDELGQLVYSISEMVEHLRTSYQQIQANNQAMEESQQRLYQIVDAMPVMLDAFDEQGRLVFWNKTCEQVTGYHREEVLGSAAMLTALYPDAVYRQQVAQTILDQRDDFVDLEFELVARNGERKVVSWSNNSRQVAVEGWASWAVGMEITQRKQGEAALKEERDRAQAYLDLVAGIFVEIDPREKVVLINKTGAALLGRLPEEIIGKNWFDHFLPPQTAALLRPRFHQLLRGEGQPGNTPHENPVLTSLGVEREILWHHLVLKDGAGNITGTLSHGVDISDRKRAENRLRDSEARLASIIDNSQAVIFLKDLHGYYLQVNKKFLSNLSLQVEQVIGKTDYHILPTEVANRVRKNDIKAVELGALESEEVVPVRQGAPRTFLSMKFSLKDEQGRPYAVCGIATDITEQKRIQWALERELETNRVLAQLARMLILPNVDLQQVAQQVLSFVLSLTRSPHGYVSKIDEVSRDNTVLVTDGSPVLGECQNNGRIVLPRDEDGFYPGVLGLSLNLKESMFFNGLGGNTSLCGGHACQIGVTRLLTVPVLAGDELAGQIVLANGATDYDERDLKTVEMVAELYTLAIRRQWETHEKRRMELSLFQAQKLEAVGTLAGGIAHDFNNILAIIVTNAEYMQLSVAEDHELVDGLRDILQASLRGRDLIGQLLAFSRLSEGSPRWFSPGAVMLETQRLLRATIPATVDIHWQVVTDTDGLLGEAVQFQQVVMNLCNNAVQAMAGLSQPLLQVALEREMVAADKAVRLNITPGDYYRLVVGDNGAGIDREIIGRIFDPFFTTKPVGSGTGLGLAVVDGIVRNYRGALEVESSEGEGTLFRVYFPVVVGEAGVTPRLPIAEPRGCQMKILFVDDEEQLMRVTVKMLTAMGHCAQGYTDPEEALAVFRENPRQFDVVMTDQTMPRMRGDELLSLVRQVRQDIPVFLCTGYGSKGGAEQSVQQGFTGYLQKPISLNELRGALQGVAVSENQS